jgi:amino-acid N-acetyltransferase
MMEHTFEITPMAAADLPVVFDLLVSNELPPDGMDAPGIAAIVARRIAPEDPRRELNDDIVGCAALELYEDAALLRSVAVRGDARDRGLGRRLVHEMLARARASGVPAVYLLTLTAAHWFPRFGFEAIDRLEAPESIRRTGEFTTLCPETAILMRRSG